MHRMPQNTTEGIVGLSQEGAVENNCTINELDYLEMA